MYKIGIGKEKFKGKDSYLTSLKLMLILQNKLKL